MSKSLEALQIPDKTRHYVKSVMNPIMEQLVFKLIQEQPENPAEYMYEYFQKVLGIHDKLLAEITALKVRG